MAASKPVLVEVPILYSTWSELAGRLIQKEIKIHLDDEMNINTEDEKKELDVLIKFIYGTKFHALHTTDHVADAWNNLRKSKLVTDIIITATTRFLTMIDQDETLDNIVRVAARAISVKTWASLADDDFVDHSLSLELATDIFKENYWFLVSFLASFFLREEGMEA